jgi:hypothetical protein
MRACVRAFHACMCVYTHVQYAKLTSDDQCVWDPGLVKHALDVSGEEAEGLALPTAGVHQ